MHCNHIGAFFTVDLNCACYDIIYLKSINIGTIVESKMNVVLFTPLPGGTSFTVGSVLTSPIVMSLMLDDLG